MVYLLLSCGNSLHILDSYPLSDILFANIFSHSIGCLSIPFVVSFAVQEIFTLIYFYLSIFASVVCAFGVIANKSLPRSMSRSFPLNVQWQMNGSENVVNIYSGILFSFKKGVSTICGNKVDWLTLLYSKKLNTTLLKKLCSNKN